LPGPFVTPLQRGVLGHLAEYYARSAEPRQDPVLDGMAALFARLSGRDPAAYRRPAGPRRRLSNGQWGARRFGQAPDRPGGRGAGRAARARLQVCE
jgi:hypothetical protein